MEKILINSKIQDIHYIKEPFLEANYTLCGIHIHPINTIYIKNKKLLVTCKKCILKKVPDKI